MKSVCGRECVSLEAAGDVLDELASLERLNSLEAALTKGRKHGLRVVAGLQSTAQLDRLYGTNSNGQKVNFQGSHLYPVFMIGFGLF